MLSALTLQKLTPPEISEDERNTFRSMLLCYGDVICKGLEWDKQLKGQVICSFVIVIIAKGRFGSMMGSYVEALSMVSQMAFDADEDVTAVLSNLQNAVQYMKENQLYSEMRWLVQG